ncbi:MAG: Rpp14/Pop5 family protein [Candidatus Thorarchaeota archaeon]
MTVIERDRYVVFEVVSQTKINDISILKDLIWGQYKLLFGLKGTTEAGLYFEFFSENTQSGLIRCNNQSLSSLMITLSFITEVKEHEVILLPLYVTGIIRKAKEYLDSL